MLLESKANELNHIKTTKTNKTTLSNIPLIGDFPLLYQF